MKMKGRPFEDAAFDLLGEKKAFQKVRDGLMTVGHMLDPNIAKQCEKMINDSKRRLNEMADALGQERRAFVTAARLKDEWASPSGIGGWLCPKSPSGICEYNEIEDPCLDDCLHCHFPQERK